MTGTDDDKKCVTFCTPVKPCYKCRYGALVAENAELRAKLGPLSVKLADLRTQMERGRTEAALTIAATECRCTELIAEAAVMRDAITRNEWVECFDAIGSDVSEACDACGADRERSHKADCWVDRILSSAPAKQARHLLDVVARARELRLAFREHAELAGRVLPQELFNAYFNLVGTLAVYDDKSKSKKEKADGEEESES